MSHFGRTEGIVKRLKPKVHKRSILRSAWEDSRWNQLCTERNAEVKYHNMALGITRAT